MKSENFRTPEPAQSSVPKYRQAITRIIPAELRTPVLTCILLVLTVVFMETLPRDPVLYEQVTRPFRVDSTAAERQAIARQIAALRAKDPPLGSHLPVPQMAPYSVPGKHDQHAPLVTSYHNKTQAYLVVMISTCSKCVMPTLQIVDLFAHAHPQLEALIVSPNKASELEAFRRDERFRLPMFGDAGGGLARAYNAAWMPRAYLLSRTGQLLWDQSGSDLDLQGALAALPKRGKA